MTEPIELSDQSDVTISAEAFASVSLVPAIKLNRCHRVTITGCTFTDIRSAVIAVDSTDIVVTDCTAHNITGPAADVYSGNFVQFDKCAGGLVARNTVTNAAAQADPEDLINLFRCTGTVVEENHLEGGGTSASGSGIMIDSTSSTVTAQRNTLINCGQVGIGIAGGVGNIVRDNDLFSHRRAGSNVGIYVINYTAEPSSGHEVRGNRVRWLNVDGLANGRYTNGSAGTVAGWDDNDWWADMYLLP